VYKGGNKIRKRLSVAVATYKRFTELNQELVRWLDGNLQDYVEFLVVNDSERLQILEPAVVSWPRSEVKLINHKRNLGYSEAFQSMLENCNTEYCLITADDDRLNISNLIDIARKIDTCSADIVAFEWLSVDGTEIKRLPAGNIEFESLRHALNHAPGIMYKRSTVLPVLRSISIKFGGNSYAFRFFPQVLLAYKVFLKGKIKFVPIPVGGYRQEGPAPSDLKDSNGKGYGDAEVQIEIKTSMIEFLLNLKKGADKSQKKKISTEAGFLCAESVLMLRESLKNRDGARRKLFVKCVVLIFSHPALTIIGFIHLIAKRTGAVLDSK
jgi:glycosyltransferase involved in cell wall biosynthesis